MEGTPKRCPGHPHAQCCGHAFHGPGNILALCFPLSPLTLALPSSSLPLLCSFSYPIPYPFTTVPYLQPSTNWSSNHLIETWYDVYIDINTDISVSVWLYTYIGTANRVHAIRPHREENRRNHQSKYNTSHQARTLSMILSDHIVLLFVMFCTVCFIFDYLSYFLHCFVIQFHDLLYPILLYYILHYYL